MCSLNKTAVFEDLMRTVEQFEQANAAVVPENDEYLKIAYLALFGDQKPRVRESEQNEINFNELVNDGLQDCIDYQGNAKVPVHWTNPAAALPREVQRHHVHLSNSDEWYAFHCVVNEMRVLTDGRRLFPTLQYGFTDLHPTDQYLVGLKMILQSPNRYQFKKGQWTVAGETKGIEWESTEVFSERKTGEEAMSGGFGLEAIKIFNQRSEWKKGPVSAKASAAKTERMLQVVPQHMYIPQLTLYRICEDTVHMAVVDCAMFKETEFLVVTGYNGAVVKQMKCDNKHVRNDVRDSARDAVPNQLLF